MNKEKKELTSLKQMFEEMCRQFAKETGGSKKDAYLQVGTMFLYFWAIANNKDEIKKSLTEETKNYFSNPTQFFKEVERDFKTWSQSHEEYINYFKALDDSDYDKLVDHIQEKFKLEKP
jgi:hypothetical protein